MGRKAFSLPFWMIGALRRPTKRAGFTLLELLFTAMIVGVMAAAAIPTYTKAIERTYWQNAQDILYTIYNGERTYYFEKDVYKSLATTSSMAEWRQIYMDNPNFGPVGYSVAAVGSGTGATFTATATRNNGSGKSMTIDQDRTLNIGSWPRP